MPVTRSKPDWQSSELTTSKAIRGSGVSSITPEGIPYERCGYTLHQTGIEYPEDHPGVLREIGTWQVGESVPRYLPLPVLDYSYTKRNVAPVCQQNHYTWATSSYWEWMRRRKRDEVSNQNLIKFHDDEAWSMWKIKHTNGHSSASDQDSGIGSMTESEFIAKQQVIFEFVREKIVPRLFSPPFGLVPAGCTARPEQSTPNRACGQKRSRCLAGDGHTESRVTRNTARKKQRENAEDEGESSSYETLSEKAEAEVGDEHVLFACHFQKAYPHHFRDRGPRGRRYKSCVKGFTNIKMLKDHLKRLHCAYVCDRCSLFFKERQARKDHLSQTPTCEPHDDPFIMSEFIDNEEHSRVFTKKPSNRSAEAHWYEMWDILFPQTPRPETSYPTDLPGLIWDQAATRIEPHAITQARLELPDLVNITDDDLQNLIRITLGLIREEWMPLCRRSLNQYIPEATTNVLLPQNTLQQTNPDVNLNAPITTPAQGGNPILVHQSNFLPRPSLTAPASVAFTAGPEQTSIPNLSSQSSRPPSIATAAPLPASSQYMQSMSVAPSDLHLGGFPTSSTQQPHPYAASEIGIRRTNQGSISTQQPYPDDGHALYTLPDSTQALFLFNSEHGAELEELDFPQ